MERMSITFLALVVLGCTSTTMPLAAQSGSTSKDAELVIPADYKSYAAFLHGIQKPDAVRDLYINPTGASAEAGQPFGNGSILVMEIYNAKKNAEGTLQYWADGNLVKADSAKVFVMQKEEGWGKGVPENVKKRRLDLRSVQGKWRTIGCRLYNLPGLSFTPGSIQRLCAPV